MTTPQSQCTNLELSKKLRDLGYPQESLFYWHEMIDYDNDKVLGAELLDYLDTKPRQEFLESGAVFSAPTVAELGEFLKRYYPQVIEGQTIVDGKWAIDSFREKTEADVRATTIVYILENKLIEL